MQCRPPWFSRSDFGSLRVKFRFRGSAALGQRAGTRSRYKAFEATIIADYDAQTAVERELVLRLASLLWRSRRAILIETGLFAIQAEILRARRAARPRAPSQPRPERRLYRLLNGATAAASPNGYDQSKIEDNYDGGVDPPSADSGRMLTHCFLHLANLENGAFERLNRYEVALWRQTVQTIVALRAVRCRF